MNIHTYRHVNFSPFFFDCFFQLYQLVSNCQASEQISHVCELLHSSFRNAWFLINILSKQLTDYLCLREFNKLNLILIISLVRCNHFTHIHMYSVYTTNLYTASTSLYTYKFNKQKIPMISLVIIDIITSYTYTVFIHNSQTVFSACNQ